MKAHGNGIWNGGHEKSVLDFCPSYRIRDLGAVSQQPSNAKHENDTPRLDGTGKHHECTVMAAEQHDGN